MLVENFFFEKITQLPSEVAQSLLAHLASLFGVIKKGKFEKSISAEGLAALFFHDLGILHSFDPKHRTSTAKEIAREVLSSSTINSEKALRLIMCIDEKSYEASSYEEKLLADLHELAVLAHDKQIELPFTVLGKSPDVSDKLHAPKNVQLRLKETKEFAIKERLIL